ncbi:nudix hydrolase 18, mitochondrial-like isoform X3 [Ananas comosus]|uniref:Nudix hydrolase 18, mitochondrial-like isoform X3 n=1 Tax=Ananas comosus TaxID=4615 RepID=A0A6P5F333_ANACO|nr:nudix hydrolase 18, mitochondrial-like isoform X3 [Ananas comosus]
MACLVARQGRGLQRYTSTGGRVVVGCIPYKFKFQCDKPIDQAVEVLVISSQKGHGMMFPKGGWESDESIHEAVCREALEEAGVQGHVESKLGNWNYTSRRCGLTYEGMMFPLNVTEELGQWPEMHARKRRWVSRIYDVALSNSFVPREMKEPTTDFLLILGETGDGGRSKSRVPACLDDRSAGQFGCAPQGASMFG